MLEENKVPNASKIMAIRVVDMFLSLTKSEGFGLLERLISLEMSHLAQHYLYTLRSAHDTRPKIWEKLFLFYFGTILARDFEHSVFLCRHTRIMKFHQLYISNIFCSRVYGGGPAQVYLLVGLMADFQLCHQNLKLLSDMPSDRREIEWNLDTKLQMN